MEKTLVAVLSFLLGWLVGKVLDTYWEKIIQSIKTAWKRKVVGRHIKKQHADILRLCSGVPHFSAEHTEVEIDQSLNLFLAFPEALRGSLPKSVGNVSETDVFFSTLSMPGYDDAEVMRVVEIARKSVAKMFIDRDDGSYFNGRKYGVAYADGFSRTTDNVETPILFLRLYNTDHFTHRVISETVNLLKVDKEQVTPKLLNSTLNWIRTSIGVSVIAVLKSTNQIIMTRRSANASYSEGKSWIYVSATETFTQTDYDEFNHTADLGLCIERGLKEELGIEKYMCDSVKLYDMFFETHFLQDGIVASVELKEDITFDIIMGLDAKDKQLEVEELFLLDNKKNAIENYIKANEQQMRSQTIYALRCHAARL